MPFGRDAFHLLNRETKRLRSSASAGAIKRAKMHAKMTLRNVGPFFPEARRNAHSRCQNKAPMERMIRMIDFHLHRDASRQRQTFSPINSSRYPARAHFCPLLFFFENRARFICTRDPLRRQIGLREKVSRNLNFNPAAAVIGSRNSNRRGSRFRPRRLRINHAKQARDKNCAPWKIFPAKCSRDIDISIGIDITRVEPVDLNRRIDIYRWIHMFIDLCRCIHRWIDFYRSI